jgi:hypothetical protein
METTLFYFILFLGAMWLIAAELWGTKPEKKYISKLADKVMGG